MFAWIRTLTTAGNKLARALAELSATVEEVNGGLRQQVGMDRPARKVKEVLDHKADASGKAAPAA
jgi:hypothetical protein